MQAVPPRDSVDGGARWPPARAALHGGRPRCAMQQHQVRAAAATTPYYRRSDPLPLDLSLLVAQLSPPESPGTVACVRCLCPPHGRQRLQYITAARVLCAAVLAHICAIRVQT